MIASAIRRRVSTLVLVLGLTVFGAMNLPKLPVDFLPDITYPLIKLSITWPGATPEDIDRNLADPIERQLAAVDGLDYLSSSALEGGYQLDVTFRYGVNVDTAYQDTLAAFARAQRDLPADADPAIVIKAGPSLLPVVQVAFESDRMDLTQLRTWIDNWLTDRLLAANGVAGVDVAGGLEREIRALIDHVALEKYGLSLGKIEQRLREEKIALLGGRVTGANQEAIVRTQGEYRDLETIRNILIARTADGRLRLRDLARVEDSHEEVRLITRLDGCPAVKVNVIKQADANTVKTVEALAARLAELAPAFPAGMQYAMLENQADYIRSSIAALIEVYHIVVDQLNTQQSEALVRLTAALSGVPSDLGVKGEPGILASMDSRAAFLSRNDKRVVFHYTPRHASWMNHREIWFGILAKKVLRGGNFRSKEDLRDKLLAFIEYFNTTPAKPFR